MSTRLLLLRLVGARGATEFDESLAVDFGVYPLAVMSARRVVEGALERPGSLRTNIAIGIARSPYVGPVPNLARYIGEMAIAGT